MRPFGRQENLSGSSKTLMSAASDTDVKLYLQLSNPEVSAQPKLPPVDDDGSEAAPDDEDEIDLEEGSDGQEDDYDDDDGGGYDDEEEEDYGDEDDVGAAEHDGRQDYGSQDYGDAGSAAADAPSPMTDPLAAPIQMSAEDILIEKQSVLMELDRLKAQGVQLTKTYTLDDDLTHMQWEVRRHLLMIDEMNSISFMKDAMRLAFSGIEAVNNKAGPLLELEGWAASASHDLTGHKYDSALSKIYKKYWRKGNSSPEMEIALGVLGSMGAYHFRKKFMSARPVARRQSAPIDDSDDEEAP